MVTEDRRRLGAPQLLALPVLAAILVAVLVAVGGRASSGPDRRAERVLGVAPIPAGNPQTPDKVDLGRLLFFDPRVMNGTMACTTCHDPTKGWSDGRPRSQGPKGELGRNSLSLFNAAYEDLPSWDGSEWSIEQHSTDAMKFFEVDVPRMVRTLGTVPEYRSRFGRVFGGEISFDNVVRAMAAFQRALLSFDTPYDRFRAGHPSALTKQQQEGMALFMGRAGCSACHTPPLFTDTGFHALGVPQAGPQAVDLAPSPSPATSGTAAPSGPRRCVTWPSPARTCMTACSPRSTTSSPSTTAAAVPCRGGRDRRSARSACATRSGRHCSPSSWR
jgi:cytochrome c peroxidase